MAYSRGNLAVQPKRRPQVEERYRETTKTVVRKSNLPGREKLLYLLTIVFCVAVAMFLMGRYADIDKLNRDIQQKAAATQTLQKEILVMEVAIEELSSWERIEKEAFAHGLVWPEDMNDIIVHKQVTED